MRGKANIGDDIGDDFRITPAYAGKSKCSWEKSSSVKDHPRLCGEKISPYAEYEVTPGSPPPMRGKD